MKRVWYILILLLGAQCRERYNVPYPSPATGYLVVEGLISPVGDSKITLSRTNKLDEKNRMPESHSVLQVQGEDNSLYYFTESDSGNYIISSLDLNPSIKYRLHISAKDGKEYVSDYLAPLTTPPIDSISWLRHNGGVEIFANAHDDNNEMHYFKWDYDETWEFHSAFKQNIVYDPHLENGEVVSVGIKYYNNGQDNDSIYRCWKSQTSSQIKTGTTAGLIADRAYQALVFHPDASVEMSILYSINVRQNALSKGAYEFYQKMKKNTESLGSIFDPLPSELKGNITCVNDLSELVIGYVDISSTQQRRKFISNSELPGWYYLQNCGLPMNYSLDPDTILAQYNKGAFLAQLLIGPPDGFSVAPEECVRCTMRGTNNKPSFWP